LVNSGTWTVPFLSPGPALARGLLCWVSLARSEREWR